MSGASPVSSKSPSSSSAFSTAADRPITESPRELAFFSQTSLPPKKGNVCKASIVERTRAADCSALSPAPSMISSPKSPASGGVNFAASSAAARFTSLSSEPTTAWILSTAGGAAFAFAFGIGGVSP